MLKDLKAMENILRTFGGFGEAKDKDIFQFSAHMFHIIQYSYNTVFIKGN